MNYISDDSPSIYDDIFIDRKEYEAKIDNFLKKGESDADGAANRFLFIGGIGGAGKTWLIKKLEKSHQSQKRTENLIPVHVEIGVQDFIPSSTDPSGHFNWLVFLEKLTQNIEEKSNPTPPLNRYTSFYDRCVRSDKTDDLRISKYKKTIRIISSLLFVLGFLFNLITTLDESHLTNIINFLNIPPEFLPSSQLKIVLTISGLLGLALSLSDKFILYFVKLLDNLKYRTTYQMLGCSPKDFQAPDDPSTSKLPRIQTVPQVLFGALKSDLSEAFKKNNIRLLFVVDVSYLPTSLQARGELLQAIDHLINPTLVKHKKSNVKATETSLHGYEKRVQVILISKQRRLPNNNLANSNISSGIIKPLDIRSFTFSQAEQFILEAIQKHSATPQPNSSLPKDLPAWLLEETRLSRDIEEKGEKTKRNRDAERILKALALGPAGQNLTLPSAVRERCEYFLDTYTGLTPEDIISKTSKNDTTKISSQISDVITNNLINLHDESVKRLFIGVENGEDLHRIKRTAHFLASFEKLDERFWPQKLPDSYKSIDTFVVENRDFLDLIEQEDQTRTISLKPAVHHLLSYNNCHLKEAETGLASYFDELFGLMSLKTKYPLQPDAPYSISLSSLALDCLASPSMTKNFSEKNHWPIENVVSLLHWIDNGFRYRERYDGGIQAALELAYLKLANIAIMTLAGDPHRTNSGYDSMLRREDLVIPILEIVSNYSDLSPRPPLPQSTNEFIFSAKMGLDEFKSKLYKSKAINPNSQESSYWDLLNNNTRGINTLFQEMFPKKEKDTKDDTADRDEELSEIATALQKYENRKRNTFDENHQLFVDLFSNYQRDPKSSGSLELLHIIRKLSSFLCFKSLKDVSSKRADEVIQKTYDDFYLLVIEAWDAELKYLDSTNESIVTEMHGYGARFSVYWLKEVMNAKGDINTAATNEALARFETHFSAALIGFLKTPDMQVIEICSAFKEVMQHSNKVDASKQTLSHQLYEKFFSCLEKADIKIRKELSIPGTNNKQSVINRLIHISTLGLAFSKSPPNTSPCLTAASGARRRYILAIIEHIRLIRGKKRMKPMNDSFENALDKFCNNFNWSKRGDLFQVILKLLAYFNPDSTDIRAGDFIVSQIKLLDSDGAKLSVPESDLNISLRKSLLPVQIYHSLPNSSDIPTPQDYEEENTDNSTDEVTVEDEETAEYIWENRYLLVNALSSPEDKASPWPVTARGGEYVARFLQLFFPFSASWPEAIPQTTYADMGVEGLKDWTGDLWMGASNSWVAVRVLPATKAVLLANGGVLQKEIPLTLGIRRHTVFERKTNLNEDIDILEKTEIRHFTNDSYRQLKVLFGEDGSVVFFAPQGDQDSRKNRTFLSMFRKVYGIPGRIYGWDENLI